MTSPKKPVGYEWMSQADNICPKPWSQTDLSSLFKPLSEEKASPTPADTHFITFKSMPVIDQLKLRITHQWPSTLPSQRLKLAKHVYTHGMHPWEHMSSLQLMRRRFVYHSIKHIDDGIQQVLALTRLGQTFLAGRVEQVKDPPSDLIITRRRHLMEYGFPQLFGIDLDANNLPVGYITDDYGMLLCDLSPKIHCDVLGILQETSTLMMHMHASGVLHNGITTSSLAIFFSRFEHGTVVEHFLPKGKDRFVLQQTVVYKLIGFEKCRLQTLPAPCLAISFADLGRFADPPSLLAQPPLINDVHHQRLTPPTYVHPNRTTPNEDILQLGQTLIAFAIKGQEKLRPETGATWQSTLQFVETLLHFTSTPNRLFEFLLFTNHCIATMLRCEARPPGAVDERVQAIFQHMFPVRNTAAPEGVKIPDFVIKTKHLLAKFHDYAFSTEMNSTCHSDTHPIEAMLRLNVQDELDAWWLSLNAFVLLSERLVDLNNHTHQIFDVDKKSACIQLTVVDEPGAFINLEAISIADMSIEVNQAEFCIYPMEPVLRIAGTTIATAHCLREMTLHKRSDRIGALPLLLKTRRFTADCSAAIEEVVEPFGVFNLHTAGNIFYTPCATRSFPASPQLIKRRTPTQRLLASLLSMDIRVLQSLGIDPDGFVPSWLYHAIAIFEETSRVEAMASECLTDTWVLLFVSSVLLAHRLFSNNRFEPNHYACCGLLICDFLYSDASLWQANAPMLAPEGDSNVWMSLASTYADPSLSVVVIPDSELSHLNGMCLVIETMQTMILTTCQWKLPQSRYAILYDLVAPSLLHDQRVLLSRLTCRWMGDTQRLATELDPRLVFIAMLDAVMCSTSSIPIQPTPDPIQSEATIANAMLRRSSKTLHFHMITSIYELPEATFTTLLIPIHQVIQALDRHLADLSIK